MVDFNKVLTDTCVDIILRDFSKGHVARLKDKVFVLKQDRRACLHLKDIQDLPHVPLCQTHQRLLAFFINVNLSKVSCDESFRMETDENLHLFFLADMLKPGQDLLFSQRSKAKPGHKIKAIFSLVLHSLQTLPLVFNTSRSIQEKLVGPGASALKGWDDFTEVVANQTEPCVGDFELGNADRLIITGHSR